MSDRHSRRSTRLRAGCACAGILCLSLAWRPEAGAQLVQIAEADPEPPANLPERHQVAKDETLSIIAERYLGKGDDWPKLWSYNPEITNPHWIYPGYVLRLKPGVDLNAPAPEAPAAQPQANAHGLGLQFAARRSAHSGAGTVRVGEEVYLDRQALVEAGRIVGSGEDHFMLSPSDEVYVRFKPDHPVPAQGKELTVFIRQHRDELAPGARKMRTYKAGDGGEIVRVLGGLKILSYDGERHIARTSVTEALDPIERGFEVTDVPHVLAQVPPKQSGRDLRAKIIAASRPLATLGDGQVVFLDAGGKAGVEVGNRFFVVRQGDPWRKELILREDLTGAVRPEAHPLPASAFPPETVAELRVLYVRPASATAVITSAQVEVHPGDTVEMRAGY